MDRIEDRTTARFKAQENEFYSNQWAYNTRIKNQEDILNNPHTSASEKDVARREKADLENERQDAIDQWKEEHGAYDEEMTKWTIDDAVKQKGEASVREIYDQSHGYEVEREQEIDEGIEL